MARIGAVSDTSITSVSACRPTRPMPTPMIAVSSGSPAASSEPSVIASTRKPTIMPRLSEFACDSSVTRPPPNSVCSPASSAGVADASSSSRAWSSILSAGTG